MTEEKDTRDMVISLRVEVDYLKLTLNDVSKKVDELHNMLQAAKGARWVLIGAAGLMGFVGAKAGAIAAFFGGK